MFLNELFEENILKQKESTYIVGVIIYGANKEHIVSQENTHQLLYQNYFPLTPMFSSKHIFGDVAFFLIHIVYLFKSNSILLKSKYIYQQISSI